MTMEQELQELDQGAIARLDFGFAAGDHGADVGDFSCPFARVVNLDGARAVIVEAMARFPGASPAQSDCWLGPRLHASLRLTRREAARKGIWRYLGVVAFPDYVRWRFTGEPNDPEAPPKLERFVGPDYKHALARLWWMAEMFRDGADYAPAVQALSNQDIINSLFRMEVAHHRPTALGAVRVLFPKGDDERKIGREANALAKAVNTTAATVLLDAFAPDAPLDENARERWITDGDHFDPALYLDDLPPGPDDPPAPPESVERIAELFGVLLEEAPVRGREREAFS